MQKTYLKKFCLASIDLTFIPGFAGFDKIINVSKQFLPIFQIGIQLNQVVPQAGGGNICM